MPQSNQARLDAMAKKQGFPNYAAMKAWNEKYRKPTTNTVPGASAKPKRNFLQNMASFLSPIGASTGPAVDAMNSANRNSRPKPKRRR